MGPRPAGRATTASLPTREPWPPASSAAGPRARGQGFRGPRCGAEPPARLQGRALLPRGRCGRCPGPGFSPAAPSPAVPAVATRGQRAAVPASPAWSLRAGRGRPRRRSAPLPPRGRAGKTKAGQPGRREGRGEPCVSPSSELQESAPFSPRPQGASRVRAGPQDVRRPSGEQASVAAPPRPGAQGPGEGVGAG